MILEILRLSAPCKDYIWGGTRLKTEFFKECSTEKAAESWELSARKDSPSVIENGSYKGLSLADYFGKYGLSQLGENFRGDRFPLLIKLIDAADDLSVQVHPDDAYGYANEGEPGKTEMWYVIDCDKDAEIIYGFREELGKEDFAQAIREGSLLPRLNRIKAEKGRAYFIPSGTLHAIGRGILVAEIQENSDTTYRVYDYDRRDKDGNRRELHIKKALDVTKLSPAPSIQDFPEYETDCCSIKPLCSCEYFKVDRISKIKGSAGFTADNKSFVHLLAVEGEGELYSESQSLSLRQGTSLFIPAGYGKYTLSGDMQLIRTQI